MQGDVVVQFGDEFTELKKKVLDLTRRLDKSETNQSDMKVHVDQMRSDNIRMATDMKMMKDEQGEMLHTIYRLEKANMVLNQENAAMKDRIRQD